MVVKSKNTELDYDFNQLCLNLLSCLTYFVFLICFGSLYCFNEWHSHITCNLAIVVFYSEHSKI